MRKFPEYLGWVLGGGVLLAVVSAEVAFMGWLLMQPA
jgi:hypothetical protein